MPPVPDLRAVWCVCGVVGVDGLGCEVRGFSDLQGQIPLRKGLFGLRGGGGAVAMGSPRVKTSIPLTHKLLLMKPTYA
jgi:hypothetical protein